jgi:hypothetical protein
MTAAKRFLEVDTDHYHPDVKVFSFLIGVKNRDGIRISDDYEHDQVIIQVNEGFEEWASVYMSRAEFKALIRLLDAHFVGGLEVLPEDADYENRAVDTLSEVVAR